jgi:hypothetical protein
MSVLFGNTASWYFSNETLNLNTEKVFKNKYSRFFPSYFGLFCNARGCYNQRGTVEQARILCWAQRSRISSRKTDLFIVQEFTVSAVICTACCSLRSRALSVYLSSLFRCSFILLYGAGYLRQYGACDGDWSTGETGVCYSAGARSFWGCAVTRRPGRQNCVW